MNIFETMRATIQDAKLLSPNGVDDEMMIEIFKLNLCFKTSQESYDTWLAYVESPDTRNIGMKKMKKALETQKR